GARRTVYPLGVWGGYGGATPPGRGAGAGRADLAVFDVADEAALRAGGTVHCVATVLAGRLVHRAR
ncbi:hypothetical protein ABZ702_32215, partial [Streptomyces cyaneofuscatus]